MPADLPPVGAPSRVVATYFLAEMARAGLHDLLPYDDPELGWVNPLDDLDVQVVVRRYLAQLRRWCDRERAAADEIAEVLSDD